MQHFCLCLSVLPYELLVAQSSMGPETSLQCSHKSLRLELTWKPHYNVHTRAFLWNLSWKPHYSVRTRAFLWNLSWKPHYSVHTRAFLCNLPGSLITMFTQEPSSGTYLEASLQCSHKNLPLELTWKIRFNINKEFVPVLPKSDYPTRILSVLLTSPIGATCCVY